MGRGGEWRRARGLLGGGAWRVGGVGVGVGVGREGRVREGSGEWQSFER